MEMALSVIPKYTEVFVNGVLVKKGQWSSGNGTTITFEEALTDPNYVIDVIEYGFVTPEVNLFLDTQPFLGGDLNTNGNGIQVGLMQSHMEVLMHTDPSGVINPTHLV